MSCIIAKSCDLQVEDRTLALVKELFSSFSGQDKEVDAYELCNLLGTTEVLKGMLVQGESAKKLECA